MKRRIVPQRPDWQERLEEVGFTFHSLDGTYWQEGLCYEFEPQEIDAIEAASAELHGLCLEAVEVAVRNERLAQLGLPAACHPLVQASWNRRDPSLYGRFDLALDDAGGIKLLEYNADTPTSLFETAVAQWLWLEELFPEADQFNSIHEKLLAAFRDLHSGALAGTPWHFACVRDHQEDLVTIEYLRDVAIQAGIDGRQLFVEDIGFDADGRRFLDLEGREIRQLFKLYPWEWLLADEFGAHLLTAPIPTILEPAWKLVLSSKGILALLWELFPDHPNLLPAGLHPLPGGGRQVRKPLFSREGANIALLDSQGQVDQETDGPYGAEGFVYQAHQDLPCRDGHYALIGSWLIDHQPAGIGIREDSRPITTNLSTFVPHLFHP